MYTGGCWASIVRTCEGEVSARRTVSSSLKSVCSGERVGQRVQPHADLAVTDVAQRELELALPAEDVDAQTLDLLGIRGRGNCGQRLALERLGIHGGDCSGIGLDVFRQRALPSRRGR